MMEVKSKLTICLSMVLLLLGVANSKAFSEEQKKPLTPFDIAKTAEPAVIAGFDDYGRKYFISRAVFSKELNCYINIYDYMLVKYHPEYRSQIIKLSTIPNIDVCEFGGNSELYLWDKDIYPILGGKFKEFLEKKYHCIPVKEIGWYSNYQEGADYTGAPLEVIKHELNCD